MKRSILTFLLMNAASLVLQAQGVIQFEKVRLERDGQRLKIVHGLQDNYGLMWAASEEDGLFDFNGISSNIYRQRTTDSANILSYHLMNYIFEGVDGNIWASGDGGYISYKRKENKLEMHPIGSKTGGLLLCKSVEADRNRLISVTDNSGVILYNKAKKRWAPVISDSPLKPSLSAIIKCKNGDIYLANDQKLFKFNFQSSGFQFLFNLDFPFSTVSATALMHNGFYEDEAGRLWLSSVDLGVIVIDPNSKKTARFYDIRKDVINSDNRKSKDPIIFKGLLYIPTGNMGVFCVDTATGEKRSTSFIDPQTRGIGEESVIASKRVFNLFEDNSGSLWACTSAGLFKYTSAKLRFQRVFRTSEDPKMEADYNNIHSFYEAPDGLIWICTMTGAVYTWSAADRKFTDIAGTPSSLFPENKVYRVLEARGGKYLLSDSCILFLSDDRRRIQRKAVTEFSLNRSKKYLDAIKIDQNRYMIACSQSLVVWNEKTDEATAHQILNNQRVAYIHIKSFHQDSKGRFWGAAMAGGVIYIDTSDFRMTMALGRGNYRSNSEHPKAMSMLDYGGYLWVGTWGDGLLKVSIPDNFPEDSVVQTERINTQNSKDLSSNVVYGVIPDGKGGLWASSNKGIFKYDISNREFKTYSPKDGLQGYEYNMNAFLKLRNGSLLFGGLSGFNLFDPADCGPNEFQNKPVISGLEVWNTGSSGENITSKINLVSKEFIVLKHSENNLRFDFFYPNYVSPEDNQYRYKLSGINQDWVTIGKNAFIILTNLPPGEYELEVSASNSDGLWSKETARFKLFINQPIWLDPLMYAFLILVMLGIFFTWLQYRSTQNKKYKTRLKNEVDRQTNEITEINKKLALQNLQLDKLYKELEAENKSKDIIFSILSHDLRSPLTTLKGLLGIMDLPGDPLNAEEVKKYLKQMQQSVDGSLQLIDTILYWYHSQVGTIKPSKKALSLSTLLEAAIAVYRPVAEKKHISILHRQDPSRVVADEDMLSVIIRNLLSNAIKFSPQGASIHIFTENLGDQVWLRIRDEGDGIEEEILKQINLRGQVVSKKGTMHEKGTGLGLALVFRFCKQNDIPIEVETLPGKGTTFLLKLPSVQSSGVS